MSSSSRPAADAVSMSFLAAFAGPALAWAVLHDPWWLWLLAGLLGANAVVAGIKESTRGATARWLKRPAGAASCDAFCSGGAAGGEPGFPSGHMTTVVLVVVGAWLRLRRPWVLLVGVPWIVATAWARQAKRCHTLLQVVAGAGVGAMTAIGLAAARGLPVPGWSD